MYPFSSASPRLPHERAARLALLAAVLTVPVAAHPSGTPDGSVANRELVAEALFLTDTLPPGGRDLNLSLAVDRGADPLTGRARTLALPRAQLAAGLGERLGFTADVGLGMDGGADPGASLKMLLRSPDEGRTGLSASLDFYGASRSFGASEAGLGFGAIRGVGPLTLRASASVLSGVSAWTPHLGVGASAAVALDGRWRALAEVVTDVAAGDVAVSAGPTIKVAMGQRTALMAGALFPVASAPATRTFLVQLTRSL